MKAAILLTARQIKVLDLPIPEPGDGEVRIKLKKVGICGSDVHLFEGHRVLESPTIIGHEGLGIVDKVGENVIMKPLGKRVVIEPNIPCQKCKYCLKGNGAICPNKKTIGLNQAGCFAEYVIVPSDFVHIIPDAISDANAVCIEPMAVAVHALFKSKAKPGDCVAIIGLGAIGLLLTHLALKLGFKVLVSEVKQNKLALAHKMGAEIVPPGLSFQEINKIWEENEVVSVFECAGIAKTATLAAMAAPRGSEIVLIGLTAEMANFQPLRIVREGIQIHPSIIYDQNIDFAKTIQLIDLGVISPDFIISKYSKLDNLQDALSLAAQGEETKIIIEI